jgi:hypothetical protein
LLSGAQKSRRDFGVGGGAAGLENRVKKL